MNISKGTQMVNQKGLTFADSAKSIKNLNEQQKAGIAVAKALAAGLHIEVYASTEAERANGAPNGFYRSSDGTIHIDLNAGDNGQGAVAYAVSHEATHFIKDFSAEEYQTYADILIEAVENKGISYDSLLDRQLAKLSALEENRGKSAEELQELAYDETIAEMSETILSDTDAAQRVSQELYKKDRTLWEKIRDFFTGLVEKLRSAYKGLDPDSDIARVTRQAIRDNEKVAQAWAEAVVEAGENYQLQDGQKNNARGGERYSPRVGTAKDGRSMYEGNFPMGTPKSAKSAVILEYIQNVWSKKPIQLDVVGEDGTHRKIMAQFDPFYDPTGERKGDASKIAGGNRHGTAAEQRVTLDLGADYHNILSESSYNYSKEESGKDTFAHDGVKTWHYYVDEIYFAEKGSKDFKPYTVSINVKERDDGAFVYSFSAEKGEFSTPGTLHAPVDSPVSGAADAELSTNMVAQDGANVNGENIRKSSRSVQNAAENQTETENFKKWFGDWEKNPAKASKVVNEDGTPKVVYHGSPADFNTFSLKYLGTNGTNEGYGFYFTDDKEIAESYSKGTEAQRHQGADGKLFEVYLDIKKPLSDTEVTMSRAEFRKFLMEMNKQVDEDGEPLDFLSNYGDVSWEGLQSVINSAMEVEYDGSDSDVNMIHSIINGCGNMEMVFNVLRKTTGYDGIIVNDATWGGDQTIYVAFNPNQIKSATDNVGTFDKGNPDIRYSNRNSGESQVDRLARKNEELKAEAEYLKQVVQIQKRGNRKNLRDRESVNAIAKGILESVNAKDTEFGKKLNDFYRDMVTVEMDYDTMRERAGELADRALEHHQAERDGYAQEVLDFLKKRRVSLTDSQIGDAEYTYGSLSEFKKAIRGSIIIDQNSTTSLDQLWQEAAAQFPDQFSAETVAADMNIESFGAAFMLRLSPPKTGQARFQRN